MSNRVSNDQLEALLDFLAENPAIARGVGLGSRSKEAVEKQWNDLANKLNAFGSGSAKSGERWKKYWADFKHKTKARVAKRRQDAVGTGGYPGSQDDLIEIDNKVLAIIGQQPVFGDSENRIPLFHSEAESPGPSYNIVFEEVVDHHGEAENLPTVCSPAVNSPSRRGHTIQVYTDSIETGPTSSTRNIADSDVVLQTQQEPRVGAVSPVSRPVAERPRLSRNRADNTRAVSPVSRPVAERPRLSRNRADNTTPSRITHEWLKELEVKRVEAETKLANAALIMAESSRLQVETARAQTDTLHALLEIVHRQSDEIRTLLQMSRIADAGSLSRKVGAPSAGTRLPEAEKIIASVYRYLQSEYDNLMSSTGDACDLSPLANILKRTAAATSVSKRIVTDILEKWKRPANSEVDTAQNKRTKFIPTFEDDDVSPIEEESSCGSPADVEEPDEDEEEEEDQYDSIEKLKVELDEENGDHSEDMEKKIRVDLASCETSSAVHHLLSSTRVETQHEPSDVLHRQAGHVELQTAPDATLDPVKTEPWDNDTGAGHAVLQTAPDATLDPVKTEPWDDDTDT